jgi:hypothetical protein
MVKFFEGLPLFPSRCVLTLRVLPLEDRAPAQVDRRRRPRVLRVSCGPHERALHAQIPHRSYPLLAPCAPAPEPTDPGDLGTHAALGEPMDPIDPSTSSVSVGPLRSSNPRQEPSALVAHARIRAGGGPSLRRRAVPTAILDLASRVLVFLTPPTGCRLVRMAARRQRDRLVSPRARAALPIPRHVNQSHASAVPEKRGGWRKDSGVALGQGARDAGAAWQRRILASRSAVRTLTRWLGLTPHRDPNPRRRPGQAPARRDPWPGAGARPGRSRP